MPSIDVSFSRIQAYERCPWLYNLVFNEGWRSGPSAPAAFGQSLHRTLAAYLDPENTTRTRDRLLEFFDERWVNEGFKNPQQALDLYEEGRRMLENFFTIDSRRSARVLFVEKEFSIESDGVMFRGTLDRVDECADGTHEIIEYKTRHDHWDQKRVDQDLQMTLYELGARESWKFDKVRLTYWFLSSGQTLETHRTAEQLEAARERVRHVAGKIREKDFTPNPAHCRFCEFARRCRYYTAPASTEVSK